MNANTGKAKVNNDNCQVSIAFNHSRRENMVFKGWGRGGGYCFGTLNYLYFIIPDWILPNSGQDFGLPHSTWENTHMIINHENINDKEEEKKETMRLEEERENNNKWVKYIGYLYLIY